MRPVNAPVRKTVIAVTAVAALSGAGIAAPAIVNAATDRGPSGRTVVDFADDHVRQEKGHHHEPGDDRSNDARETNDSGLDSPHDRAERTSPNGRHIEPGDDHGNHVEPGDDHGGRSGSSGHGGDDSGSDDSGHGSDDSGHGGGDD
jgi:hypothetical protein